MDKAVVVIPPAIEDAIAEIRGFNAVAKIAEIKTDSTKVVVQCNWTVSLPNRDRHKGQSSSGIQAVESVFWIFPLSYPLFAPQLQLRADFPTHFPHIYPHKTGEGVPPCISDAPLIDVLHSRGLGHILSACNLWLANAAANELQCPVQGWEPIRRDQSLGMVLVDATSLRETLATEYAIFRYFNFQYHYLSGTDSPLVGLLNSPALGSSNTAYKEKWVGRDEKTGLRYSPATLFQPPKGIIVDQYHPDTVSNLGDLKRFAKSIGLVDALNARLKHIVSLLGPQPRRQHQKTPVEEFIIAFAIERPFPVIGTASPHELIPYRVLFQPGKNGSLPDDTPVHSTWFMDRCTPSLLRAVSGTAHRPTQHLSVLGCGSLGSKMSLHLAKSGNYEFDLYDKDFFSSHNNARHGLVSPDFSQLFASKASLLAQELAQLGVKAVSNNIDIRHLGQAPTSRLSVDSKWIIDTTASLTVRHFLAHNIPDLPGPLIHSAMYGHATLGIVIAEPADRSIRVDDLCAYLNTLCIDYPEIRKALHNSQSQERLTFGEGCSSSTTMISDVDLSLMSSALTAKIERYICSDPTASTGQLHIASLNIHNLNINWRQHQLSSTVRVAVPASYPWNIRLVGNVAHEIEQNSKLFPGMENGGALGGQICQLSKTIYVTKVIDAPAGSKRAPDRFDLALKGLEGTFRDIYKNTNGRITCLGTWHSHTQPCPPSPLDKETLETLQGSTSLPVVMLVYTGGKIELVIPD